MPVLTRYDLAGRIDAPDPLAPEHPATCGCPACEDLRCLTRTRFYTGQLLTERDLNDEQQYVLAKNRLHNRYLHGTGIVCGLDVACHECRGWVTVKPGYALDPCGNDVVVCEEKGFDVVAAIKECRAATARAARTDCDPIVPASEKACADAEETWCVTIAYKELPTRVVNSLARQSAACACGANGNGNGKSCRCGRAATVPAASTTPTTSADRPIGCEPSRIAECFELGVARMQKGAPRTSGSYLYDYLLCERDLRSVAGRSPVKAVGGTSADYYRATCIFLRDVRDIVAARNTFDCSVLERLAAAAVPKPPKGAAAAGYEAKLDAVVDQIKQMIMELAEECRCRALIPPCPADPGDPRLILACVTVEGDRIVRICHGEGRRQLLTFPVLEYWVSDTPVAFRSAMLSLLLSETDRARVFELNCCGPRTAGGDETTSSDNPGAVYRKTMRALSQVMSADVLTEDPVTGGDIARLRPIDLIGREVKSAESDLRDLKVTHVVEAVDDWPDAAVALAESATPGNVPADSSLVVYQRGGKVVGVDLGGERGAGH